MQTKSSKWVQYKVWQSTILDQLIASQWRFDEKMTTDLWEFQRNKPTRDLLIFVPDYFLVKCLCLQTKWYKFGRLAYHAYLNLLRMSKAWLPSPMRRFLESEQCKQNFLYRYLVGDCLLDIILIDWEISTKHLYPNSSKKETMSFFHIQSKRHIHHFSLNINTSRS